MSKKHKTSPSTQIKLTPQGAVNKSYFQIVGNLIDDSQLSQVQGSGGWQVVDRPKNTAATQWYDRSPFQLQMTVVFEDDKLPDNRTVQDMVDQLTSWLDPIPNTYQPPVFKITGPVLGGANKMWFLYSVQFEAAIRDFSTGKLLQQGVQITCYEYNSPIPGSAGHAAAASKKSNNSSTLYTVKTNETLQKIAAGPQGWKSSTTYHSLQKWITQVGKLNPDIPALRDPKDSTVLKQGTKIKIPK